MKKTISTLIAVALISTLIPATVLAHGHGGKHSSYNASTVVSTYVPATANYAATQQYYGLCNVTDCSIIGTHKHDGIYYYGHHYNDGHSYHDALKHVGGYHHY